MKNKAKLQKALSAKTEIFFLNCPALFNWFPSGNSIGLVGGVGFPGSGFASNLNVD
jgi:hypothetical protein